MPADRSGGGVADIRDSLRLGFRAVVVGHVGRLGGRAGRGIGSERVARLGLGHDGPSPSLQSC